MRIFNVEPQVNDLDGFKPELDLFKRAALGEGLTHLLTTVDQPLVVALDADWGSGKTVFLKMWAGELRKLGVPVIYFDAFANDYNDDAFLALAGEVIQLAQKKTSAEPKEVKKLTGKAINVGKVLLRGASKIAVKAATLGALDGTEVEGLSEELSGDIADETSEIADKYLERVLTSAGERKATLEEFRQALSNLPSVLASASASEDGAVSPYPLVFIIDELDRCIPPFALQILERVKHVFSVPRVHFVLGVHLEQLGNSVKAQYGSGIDARTYLQKFIHVTIPLVDTAEHENESVSKKYIEFISGGIAPPNQQRSLDLLNEFMLRYARKTGLNLRGLQRIYATIALAFSVSNDRTLFIAPLVAGLAILKLEHPSLYKKAKVGTLKFAEVEDIFGFKEDKSAERHSSVEWASDFWRYAIDPAAPEELLQKYDSGLWQYNISRARLLSYFANQIIDRFKPRQ